MRKVKTVIVLCFLIICLLFSIYKFQEYKRRDENAPVITFEEKVLHISATATDNDFLDGVKAFDEEDGDITEDVQITGISFVDNKGERVIKYIVFDSANNIGSAERVLVYSDYVPPRIYLKEPLRFWESDYEEKLANLNIEAVDCIDGDITSDVVLAQLKPETYENKVEDFNVNLQVTNSAGDSCIVSGHVRILDKNKEIGKFYPVLSQYTVYTSVGQSVDLNSYLIGISSNETSYVFGESGTPSNINASKVHIGSNVDYETPGCYVVTYSYTTRDNKTGITELYVIVED